MSANHGSHARRDGVPRLAAFPSTMGMRLLRELRIDFAVDARADRTVAVNLEFSNDHVA